MIEIYLYSCVRCDTVKTSNKKLPESEKNMSLSCFSTLCGGVPTLHDPVAISTHIGNSTEERTRHKFLTFHG